MSGGGKRKEEKELLTYRLYIEARSERERRVGGSDWEEGEDERVRDI